MAHAEIIGIDLSFAVDAARTNLEKRRNCHFIQADIFHLPFKANTFDTIFSIGVLHHTPDTKKAFLKLPPLLKTGGKMAIWVYGLNTFRPYTYFGDFWRQITPKLPKRLLYYLCYFCLPAYYLYKIPHLGSLINIIFPFSTDPNWRWRILDTFDWYSPQYQWKHTYPEVIAWFKQARVRVVKILDYEASVLGQK
jgi:SAM-dependent methyltransferase